MSFNFSCVDLNRRPQFISAKVKFYKFLFELALYTALFQYIVFILFLYILSFSLSLSLSIIYNMYKMVIYRIEGNGYNYYKQRRQNQSKVGA